MSNYYWTDITIPVTGINAKNAAEAEALINEFLDKVALIMVDKVRWDNADWTIQEDTLDEAKSQWVTSLPSSKEGSNA